MTIKIYQTFHKPFPYIKSDWIQPIGVGGYSETGFVKDNVGDNIAHLNPYYAEFTSWYWAWKNDCDYDTIGFYHYRRYLHLKHHDEDFTWGGKIDKGSHFQVDFEDNPHMLEKVTSEEYKNIITDTMKSTDVIAGFPMRFPVTVTEQWAQHHPMPALFTFLEELKNQYSNDQDAINSYFSQYGQIVWPILILKGSVFKKLCESLFPVLDRVFARIGTPYDAYQNRYLCFLVERFIPFWLSMERMHPRFFPTITFYNNSNHPLTPGQVMGKKNGTYTQKGF